MGNPLDGKGLTLSWFKIGSSEATTADAIVTDNDSMGPSKRRSVVMSRIFLLKKIFSVIVPFPAKGFPIDE